jgi:hypothetical protein
MPQVFVAVNSFEKKSVETELMVILTLTLKMLVAGTIFIKSRVKTFSERYTPPFGRTG